MNRIIKFRGKRLQNGEPTDEWVYGSLRMDYGGIDSSSLFKHDPDFDFSTVGLNACEIYDPKAHTTYAVNSDTVGQFTGLLDIHGEEIFEGDILDTKTSDYCPNGYQFICEWIDSGFALMYQGRTYSEKRKNPWMNRYPLCKKNVKDLCIVGNIHDNPELMK